jgi:hypothetical protein
MDKLAMMSILFATILVPAACARDSNGARGLRRMLLLLLLFDLAYVLYVTQIHTRYYVPAGRGY